MSEAQVMDNGFEKVLAAGRSLWLAGLGAVAEVEEGSREMFGRLVKRGRPVERRQKKAAQSVAERVQSTARELGQLVQDTIAYESRGMLKRLNVMTLEDVKILSARLETLSKKLDEYAARREAAAGVTPDLIPNNQIVAGAPKAAARPRQRKTTRER
jgi:poly(hydroxyalkanoate) granule-associated protein